ISAPVGVEEQHLRAGAGAQRLIEVELLPGCALDSAATDDAAFHDPHPGDAETARSVVDEYRGGHDFGQWATSCSRVWPRSWGSTLVCPTIGMKLVSPPHRGTTCWCRWAAIPAPAASPRFMPTLKPWAP